MRAQALNRTLMDDATRIERRFRFKNFGEAFASFASSCALLIRGNIAAVRQKIHSSHCPNFPSHL